MLLLTNNLWVAKPDRGGTRGPLKDIKHWVTTPFCLIHDRSVVVPVKKPPPGSLSVNTVGTPTTGGVSTPSSTPNIFAAATATPKSMINTTGEGTGVEHLCTSRWFFVFNSTACDLCVFKQTDSDSVVQVFVWATNSNSAVAGLEQTESAAWFTSAKYFTANFV